jgi:histidyl-tRNA synthetase
MDCEVDLLLLATTVLQEFGLHDYRFVLNHRKILEAQLRRAGIAVDKKADALRALDKFDKIGRAAMIEEAKNYGLDETAFVAFISQLGITAETAEPLDNLAYLQRTEALLSDDADGKKAASELRYIVERAAELGFADRLTVDPTLARGLDYYTGPIFEAKARVEKFGTTLSFAGGGRYDDLIGLYGGQAQGAVGFSFGVERLIDLLKEQVAQSLQTARPVLVAPLGAGRIADAERVAMALRQAGIATRISLGSTAPGKHLQYAESSSLDFVIFVGEDEVKQGIYPCKQLSNRSEQKLSLPDLIEFLRQSGVALI